MTPKRFYLLMLVGAMVVAGLSAGFYPYLPTEMASHWSGGPQPDGTMPKLAFVILMSFLALWLPLFVSLFAYVIGQTHPHGFAPTAGIALAMHLFLLYVYLLVLLWNVGVPVDMNAMMKIGGGLWLASVLSLVVLLVQRIRE